MLVFEERGKTENNQRKTSWSRVKNQQRTNPHMATTPELNTGHIGGSPLLQPLRCPYSPGKNIFVLFTF